jgi:hypothetical protein
MLPGGGPAEALDTLLISAKKVGVAVWFEVFVFDACSPLRSLLVEFFLSEI